MVQPQRVLEWAHVFVEEVRRELEKTTSQGADLPPRLRVVNVRAGQTAPELRTLAIPVPPGGEGSSPEILSSLIAPADDGSQGQMLIAEARDRGGTRLFMMQPFRVEKGKVRWQEPLEGGWQDPGGEEMILDAAFGGI